MYFSKQRYQIIVPEKSGISRFSASHDIDLFVQQNFPLKIAMWRWFTIVALWLMSQLIEGGNSVEQKVIVSDTIVS